MEQEIREALEKAEKERDDAICQRDAFWGMVKDRGKELTDARKGRLDYQNWVVEGMRRDAQRYEDEASDLRARLKQADAKITALQEERDHLLAANDEYQEKLRFEGEEER